jgi:uncharacterized protein HemX
MSTPLRAAPNPLARIRLELASGGGRRGWIVWCALVGAALLIGAAGGRLVWAERVDPLPGEAAALQQLETQRQALEQSRLQLRVADARSHELERQIDALNQRLRECQEELGFFRKARDGRR